MNKEKIFVSAYACEPDKGSEIGVGWHWILEMSKQFDLWVLTRKSNRDNIEMWMDKNPQIININFVYFDLPKSVSWWKSGLSGVRTYYVLWQKCSNKIVRETMIKNDIKIYHLLTYGNALWPASKYGKKQFFVWGPIGGTDTISAEFSKHYGVKARVLESIRRNIVRTLPFNYGFVNRCKNADLILCKTQYMYENIPERYRNKATVFTDVAIDNENAAADLGEFDKKDNVVRYIAVGRFDAWRGFDLLIEAFSKANKVDQNILLHIIGSGGNKRSLQKLIEKYDMQEKILLLGKMSKNDYVKEMKYADVVVNPTLKEGGVTVAFDAMNMGKSLICLDTKGYTRYFHDEYAIVLKKCERNLLIQKLAQAIVEVMDAGRRKAMGAGAKAILKNYTWMEKGKEINNLIQKNYIRVNTGNKK